MLRRLRSPEIYFRVRRGSVRVHQIAGLVVAAAMSLALAGPAIADPGNGATVVDKDECYEDPDRGSFCVTFRYVYNVTEAGRSGNVNVTFVNRHAGTYTGTGLFEGCSFQSFDRDTTHVLVTSDGDGVFHFSGKSESSNVCPSTGQNFSCVTEVNYTYANGEVRHDSNRFYCDEPAA